MVSVISLSVNPLAIPNVNELIKEEASAPMTDPPIIFPVFLFLISFKKPRASFMVKAFPFPAKENLLTSMSMPLILASSSPIPTLAISGEVNITLGTAE